MHLHDGSEDGALLASAASSADTTSSEGVHAALEKPTSNQWTMTIVGSILAFSVGIGSNWIGNRSQDSSTLAGMSANVASMQEQMREMRDDLKKQKELADKEYVRQEEFAQYVAQQQANHQESVQLRTAQQQELDEIKQLLQHISARR